MLDLPIGRLHQVALALTCTLGALAGCDGGATMEETTALAEEATASPETRADPAAWPTDCDEKYRFVANEGGGPFRVPTQYEGNRQFLIDVPWAGQSVQAVAIRPIIDNKKVVHHFTLVDHRVGLVAAMQRRGHRGQRLVAAHAPEKDHATASATFAAARRAAGTKRASRAAASSGSETSGHR